MGEIIFKQIERLAGLNLAADMMGIADNLKDERKIIVNYLKVMEVIELDEKGGFRFIGEKSEEYKKHYYDSYEYY